MKIAIIVHKTTLDKCTGKGCLNAFFQRNDAFATYGPEARLVAFTHDGGELDKKIGRLKQLGVEVVHLSSCVRSRNPAYEALARKLSENFAVVGYTHGSRQGRTRAAICLPARNHRE